MIERFVRNEEVVGLIPICSTRVLSVFGQGPRGLAVPIERGDRVLREAWACGFFRFSPGRRGW